MSLRQMTRMALILTLMIIFQSLRLILPVPPFISIFIIGSLVNACLLMAVELAGWRLALAPAVAAPVVACLQQMLPSPIFALPIMAGNGAYVLSYAVLAERGRMRAVGLAAAAKFGVVYFGLTWLLTYVLLPAKFAAMLTLLLGWPQIITGIAGGVICLILRKRLFGAE